MARLRTFHNPFHTPFRYGNAGAAPSNVPNTFPFSIDDHPFMAVWGDSDITTLPIRRQSIDDSPEPGEQTLSAAGIFPRAQDNWFLGCDQEYLDNRFAMAGVYSHSGELPSVRTRFSKSQGVNPWVQGQLSLLTDTYASATSTSNLLICVVGSYLVRTDGKDLYYAATPVTSGSSWTKVTSGVTNTLSIESLTSDGTRVWFACGTEGVFVTTSGTWTVTAAATPAHLAIPQGLAGAIQPAGTIGSNITAGSQAYYVTAVDAFGKETAASTVTVTIGTTPVALTWSANTNASSFNVYRGSGTNKLIANVTSPSFTDDGSVANQTSATNAATQTDQTGTTAYPATWIFYAKGHLLASTGRDLVEVLASGNVTFIFQHVNPSFTFNCGAEAPTAILVGGYAGSVSFVGSIQPDSTTSGATLAPPLWATSLGVGEKLYSMVYEGGAMLLGTSRGIRQGTKPDGLGVFDVGPAIETPEASQCVAAWGQYGYFGWSNYNPSETWAARSTHGGIGRCDLSNYTTPGVPAFATDLMGASAGTTTGVVVVNGAPYFVVLNGGTYTLYVPSSSLVASGWIEPGWIRYGTIESKILVEVDYHHEPLPAGGSVTYAVVSDDLATVTTAGSTTVTDSTGTDSGFSGGLSVGNRFMPIITMTRGTDTTTGPTLSSHITKALVITNRQDQITLVVPWANRIATEGPSQHVWSFDTWSEYQWLKAKESTGVVVQLQMGSYVRQAIIDQVRFPIDDTDDTQDWFESEKVTIKLISLSN